MDFFSKKINVAGLFVLTIATAIIIFKTNFYSNKIISDDAKIIQSERYIDKVNFLIIIYILDNYSNFSLQADLKENVFREVDVITVAELFIFLSDKWGEVDKFEDIKRHTDNFRDPWGQEYIVLSPNKCDDLYILEATPTISSRRLFKIGIP